MERDCYGVGNSVGPVQCDRCGILYPVCGGTVALPGAGSSYFPARPGDGRDLEHQLKGVRALSSDGKLEGETVFLTDMGLTQEGLAAAAQLCRKYPALRFCELEREDSQT